MIDWLRREALEPEIEIAGRILPIELHRNRRGSGELFSIDSAREALRYSRGPP